MLVPVIILFICLLVLAQLIQSYALCLLPSLLRCCSFLLCLLFLCRSLLVLQLFHCVSLSAVQCMLGYFVCTVYAGITCPAFLAYDWVTGCWDSLSLLFHAGIVCLAFLAYDWAVGCWDSLSVLSTLG